ncbi:MAG: hypothetical protein V4689_06705 [Verrucomicrobiota bacterium]
MSDREKKLLIFFAIAGFAILNFLGFNLAQAKRIKVNAEKAAARQQLANADMFRESSQGVTEDMEWLAEHEPEPAANQDVQTKLQQVVEREANSAGLTIKPGQKPLPTDTTGTHYHRARIQISVTGSEDALYRWFDKLNIPEQFRMASQIRLSPNTQDDTKIDCTATIEQWFVPATS